MDIEEIYFNIIMVIQDRPTANIIVKDEILKAVPLNQEKIRCPLSPLLLNIILKVLSRAIRQEKGIKVIQIGKEEVKLSQFVGSIFLKKSPKDPNKLLEIVSTTIKIKHTK